MLLETPRPRSDESQLTHEARKRYLWKIYTVTDSA